MCLTFENLKSAEIKVDAHIYQELLPALGELRAQSFCYQLNTPQVI